MAPVERTPYRSPDEPQAETLFTAQLSRILGSKGGVLAGAAAVSLFAGAFGWIVGSTEAAVVSFVAFVGAAGTLWRRELRHGAGRLSIVRVGESRYLRIMERDGVERSMRFPLTMAGWSHLDSQHYVAALVLRDRDGVVVTIGGGVLQAGAAIPDAARQDEWFDGALRPPDAPSPQFVLSLSSLVALRDAIEGAADA